MKRLFFLLIGIAALITCAFATRQFYVKIKPGYSMNNEFFNDYNKEWKEIDSLESKGLPQSALKIVNQIYEKAKTEKNYGQFVKAVIHRLKFTSYVEDDAFVLSLVDLKKEALTAEYPAKQILHSMLAEMYWNYYQQNRYRFLNRTTTQDFASDDIRTWDLQTIIQNVKDHYLLSLDESEKLKKTNIDVYEAVLYIGHNTRQLRPTLYDFLANRAIDFFKSSESSLTQPAEQFLLREQAYFGRADQFIKHSIQTTDSLNFKFYAITLLQQLIQFRLSDNNSEALMDVDLNRLAFVYQQSVNPEKEKLYLQALQELEEKYVNNALYTDIVYQHASLIFSNSQKYNPLQSTDHKWEAKQAYDLCDNAIKKFPESNGAANCRSLQSSIQTKNIQLTLEKINLPDEAFRGRLSFKNTSKLYARVVNTNRDEYFKIHTKDEYYYSDEYKQKLIKFYAAKKPTQQFEINLPVDGDYQQHAVEVKIPALPSGDYIILVGTDANLKYESNVVAYDFVTVSSISYIHRNLPTGEMEFYVTSRKTGEPLLNAKAQIWFQEYDYKNNKNINKRGKSFITDKGGYFQIPATKEYRNFAMEFIHNNDRLITDDEFTRNGYQNSFYQYQSYAEDTSVHTTSFYFTDRAIYRPGQTIYFKGLVLDTDGKKYQKIKNKYHVSVSLHDVNSQVVSTLQLITNEFGTFSGTFTAPASGLNGEMSISDGYGSASFSVEDYKRPKFEVTIPNLKGSFRLNDEVKVKGNAQAYSGANIDNANLSYRVVRNAVFPYWWYCWRGYYPSSPDVEITNGVAKTDANGEFEITFNAIPDWSVPQESNPTYNYTIYADVTDLNGETRSTQTSVSIGHTALKVSVAILPQIEKEGKDEFNITTVNLNGEFEPAKGTITISKLKNPDRIFRERVWDRPDTFILSKEESYKYLPHDIYDDENNPTRWDKESNVVTVPFNTQQSKSLSLHELKKWTTGKYILQISSTDKFGNAVQDVAYFDLVDKQDKHMPVSSANWFKVIKGIGEPGEKASILTGSSNKIFALYEIEKDNKIISKQWLQLNNEQKLLEIPLKEDYRGNIGVHYTFTSNNRLYTHNETIIVPYTNKLLDVTFETFRNKLLPGEKEEWKIRVCGKQGDKVMAEMVATLYDASLDAFRANYFDFNIYNTFYESLGWSSMRGFDKTESEVYENSWNTSTAGYYKDYDALNWFGYNVYYYNRLDFRAGGKLRKSVGSASKDEREVMSKDMASEPMMAEVAMGAPSPEKKKEAAPSQNEAAPKPDKPKAAEEPVKARTNFNETAFFYPQLQTDPNGDILISFTIPEALTKWKMLGFAHTQDLKYGFVTNELVTQKELMINSNAPRFFREGDKITFTSKVTNISDGDLTGTAQLLLFDAFTMKPLDNSFGNAVTSKNFSTTKGQSAVVKWDLSIPEGIDAVTYRVIAKAGKYSDGEEMPVPILTNRMLVTESLPLPIRGNQTKTFTLDKLVHNQSTTLRNHKLTLEFTANPAWYAIQALPYLMEYPYECAEQTFSRFYANSIASHIANSSPKIKTVFDSWKQADSKALLSNLEKNQELKSLMLEETPWVLDAKDESERKKRVALLFDLNRMSNELDRAITKLSKMQNSNGGWPWFDGMKENWYITQHIVTGLGHLDHLGIKKVRDDDRVFSLTRNAISFIDEEIRRDYEDLKKREKLKYIKLSDNNLGYTEIQYLYARSFFKDIAIPKKSQEAFNYFKNQAVTYWLERNKYMQGMIALGLYRWDERTVPAAIVKSLREHALVSDEMGMYWKNESGYYWYQAPVETQALLIEVFDEVAHDDKAVDDMKVWLLKQKQTQDWHTTKATTEACYALLLKGTDWLTTESAIEIKVGSQIIDPKKLPDVKAEAGTGYFKTSWNGEAIKPEMGNITITKKDAGVSWGGLYWQYFEQLDKITPHETPLKLKKELFLQKNSATGPVITPITEKTILHPGDLIKVRIELRVDKAMEYVHMKDMRASSFEPTNVLSQFKYQDGLGYYESTRDAATNFFFDYLPKGTFVFEYPLRVTHQGNFSNGITSIQCMYAPEFGSHSQGVRVTIAE